MNDINADFAGKYRTGGVGAILVNRFFKIVGELISRTGIRDGRVLEVGCAQGYSTQRLQTMFSPNVRMDASDLLHWQAVRAHRRLAGVSVCCESIYQLARSGASVDLMLALEVLEHVQEPTKALRELHRVTRGFCIISVPREPLWCALNMARGKYLRSAGNTPGHLNHWSTRGIQRFVARWFRVVAVRTPLPWTVLLLQPIP